MLQLRRGKVVSLARSDDRIARASVEVEGELREAIAYPALTGPLEEGDEVVVNVEAKDLGLGSGGFDVVHVNLTRGLTGSGSIGAHVMKLNYTSLQHAVHPLEDGLEEQPVTLGFPVGVLALHGQLAPAAFALSSIAGRRRVGYVQTEGGALPGQLSDVMAELMSRGMLADHVTAAPCFGGSREAITLEGALHAGVERLEWDAALVGPGPGILGSASALGHGGLAALHGAHSALALGCEVTLAPRLSSGDPRERHRGLSHHTRTVLGLLLRPVSVAMPGGIAPEARAELEEVLVRAGHRGVDVDVDDLVENYRVSGLPTETMGRTLDQDEDFFRAALAAGAVLAQRVEDRR